MTFTWAILAGLGAAIVYLTLCLAVGGPYPLRLIEGTDNRLSTSKAQWFLWTLAVAFAYVAVYTARAVHGDHSALSTVPHNVLIALGFSTGTMVAAKGITWAYAGKGTITKNSAENSSIADLVTDDTGAPDLSKTQLLIFTFIAIGIFLINVFDQINKIDLGGPTPANSTLPDIDTVLMILMGLSQGGYLGKKLVTMSAIGTLFPSSVNVTAGPATVTLYGTGFGDPLQGAATPLDSGVTLDGYEADVVAGTWSDTKITFTVDPERPPVSTWQAGVNQGTLKVGVTSSGQPSSSTVDLFVTSSPRNA